jgi:MFS family permease
LLVGCFNFVTVPGNLISGLLVDYFGRRKFFLCGAASLCVVLCVECALTARFADTGSTNKVGLGFGVAFIFMFPVFYSLFLDATMYLYPSEVSDLLFEAHIDLSHLHEVLLLPSHDWCD